MRTPDYQRDGITLYCGDCLELLPELSGVDTVVTDPPYGDITHSGARTRTIGADSDSLVTFSSMTNTQAVDVFRLLVALAKRWVVGTVEWRHAAEFEKSGLPLVRLGVWIKPNGAPQLTGDRPATGWEAVAILHREGKKRWNGGGSRAVYTCNRVNATFHPTEKPVELFKQFIELFSDETETVLDPFMGSGTTGVACINTGRNFIGIEKDPTYFATAVKRINAALDADRDSLWTAKELAKETQRVLL